MVAVESARGGKDTKLTDEVVLGETLVNGCGYRVRVSRVRLDHRVGVRIRLSLLHPAGVVRIFDMTEKIAKQVGDILRKIG